MEITPKNKNWHPPMNNKPEKRDVFRKPALEIRQGMNRTFYAFAIDGKLLPRFATVSRIRRQSDNALSG